MNFPALLGGVLVVGLDHRGRWSLTRKGILSVLLWWQQQQQLGFVTVGTAQAVAVATSAAKGGKVWTWVNRWIYPASLLQAG